MHAWQSCDGGGEGPENKGAWQHDGRERPQERYCLTRLFEPVSYTHLTLPTSDLV